MKAIAIYLVKLVFSCRKLLVNRILFKMDVYISINHDSSNSVSI